MRIGLFGLPLSGKTTVFNALSGLEAGTQMGKSEENRAVVKVPDQRLDILTEIYKPKKTVHATVEYIDLPGVQNRAAGSYWGNLRTADVLVHVARAFESDEVPHVKDKVDFVRDIRDIESELILADLAVTENNLDKVSRKLKAGKQQDLQSKYDVLIKCQQALENETPLRSLSFDNAELESIQSYQYLSQKPLVVVLNIGEDQSAQELQPQAEQAIANMDNVRLVAMCGKLEMEVGQLEGEEQELFLEDLGIEELALYRFIRECFQFLGLISFFTVGEDEVRAWPIRQNSKAVEAAGTIHSDLQRGFIRAEVFHYNDLMEVGKDPNKLKEAGKWRLEGKDYIVKDGDILCIRFNVSGGGKKK